MAKYLNTYSVSRSLTRRIQATNVHLKQDFLRYDKRLLSRLEEKHLIMRNETPRDVVQCQGRLCPTRCPSFLDESSLAGIITQVKHITNLDVIKQWRNDVRWYTGDLSEPVVHLNIDVRVYQAHPSSFSNGSQY